jgi:type IV secretory pathway VirB10-like protein
MEQRKKIVIPLGESSKEGGGATVRASFFDEEATMGARPVVPIVEASTPQPRHLPLLALVVILAVSAGLAGGFAIGLYKSRQNKAGAAAPAVATTTATTEQAAQTPAQAQLPATIASEKSPAPQPRTVTAENAPAERAARDESPKRDEDKVSAPVMVRERAEEKRDRDERDREDRIIAREEERESRRQQRQERRRRAREREEADNGDIDRQVERGTRELNRIREIFEGQRP